MKKCIEKEISKTDYDFFKSCYEVELFSILQYDTNGIINNDLKIFLKYSFRGCNDSWYCITRNSLSLFLLNRERKSC
jgi:hypothetical protein